MKQYEYIRLKDHLYLMFYLKKINLLKYLFERFKLLLTYILGNKNGK